MTYTDKTTAAWVVTAPDLRGTQANIMPTLVQQPDGQLLIDDLPVIEQYELDCGVVVLGTAGGAVLMSMARFHEQLGDL